MTDEKILEEIKPLFNECCGTDYEIPEIKSIDDNLYGDLGLTSLTVAEVCMLIENKFNISLDDDDIADIRTIQDLITIIKIQLIEKEK